MMKQQRKHYSGQQKVAILRRHLLEHIPVSDVCDEIGLAPTIFYRWQKEFFENGAVAFERKSKREKKYEKQQTHKVKSLEAKLVRKNEVLSELMEEHVKLKKELGEL